MMQRTRTSMVAAGASVAAIGGIVTIVFFFQPWRSCDYEDTSTGCAMLPADAMAMAIAMSATIVGLLILFLGVTASRRHSLPHNRE